MIFVDNGINKISNHIIKLQFQDQNQMCLFKWKMTSGAGIRGMVG